MNVADIIKFNIAVHIPLYDNKYNSKPYVLQDVLQTQTIGIYNFNQLIECINILISGGVNFEFYTSTSSVSYIRTYPLQNCTQYADIIINMKQFTINKVLTI